MLEMLQNIDLSCGFCRTANITKVAVIQKCCECCKLLMCLVDFAEYQIMVMLYRFQNVGKVAEY